jgi:hypothetical protein
MRLPACTTACTSEAENGENPTSVTDPDLARLIEVWPSLPDAIRRGILAMVNASN